MAADTNYLTTSTLTDFLRTLYTADLLSHMRPQLVIDQFCARKNEPGTQHAKDVYFTRVWDSPAYIGTLTENEATVPSAVIDDDQVSVTVYEHGFVWKTTKYLEVTQYLNNGNLASLIRDKVGFHCGLTLDTLARNKFLAGSYASYASTATSRATLTSGMKMAVDYVDQAIRNLKSRDVLSVDGNNVIGICHPATIYDIRNDDEWVNAVRYAGSVPLFTGETGMWGGCRFIETTRMRLPNAGTAEAQTTLSSGASKGATTITVADADGFAAGDEISIGTGSTVLETDTTLEHQLISSIDGTTITLTRKLAWAHDSGAYVTEGLDIYPMIIIGATPSVGKGIGLDCEIRVMPPVDDLGRLNRAGWYGILGYGILNDYAIELVYGAASAPTGMLRQL